MSVTGTTASISLMLAPGYDNVVVYLMSYWSPQAFPQVGGRYQPLFPQTLSHQRVFTLRAGSVQTISIELPIQGVGWQIDAGCVPGPATLNNRASYPSAAFLEAAVGNRTP
jgi:hypothetical protein